MPPPLQPINDGRRCYKPDTSVKTCFISIMFMKGNVLMNQSNFNLKYNSFCRVWCVHHRVLTLDSVSSVRDWLFSWLVRPILQFFGRTGFNLQHPSRKTVTWPLVFAWFHLKVTGCIILSSFGLRSNTISFFPHFCTIIYRSVKKNTLGENIYLICWPIEPWLTLFGPCGSVPPWRVLKNRFSQQGVGRAILG